MTVPLVVLAFLAAFGGFIGVPYALSGGKLPNYFERTLEPAIAHAPERIAETGGANAMEQPQYEMLSPPPQQVDGASPLSVGEGAQGEPVGERAPTSEETRTELLFTGISVLIALLGIGIGWAMFKTQPLRKMPRLLEEKYYVDEIYDAAIVNPIHVGSREGLWKIFDIGVIDGIVNGLGSSVREIGGVIRYLQIGFVRSYAAIILLGALAIIGYFVFLSVKAMGY